MLTAGATSANAAAGGSVSITAGEGSHPDSSNGGDGGAIVLDGAVVESRVMIGAGSLVPPGKTLESGLLYVGSPCRPARELTEKELAYFTYTAGYYVGLKDEHRAEAG